MIAAIKPLIAGATTVILAASMLLSISVAAGEPKVDPIYKRTYSLQQMQSDYHQLLKKIMSKHPRLYDKDGSVEKLFNDRYYLLKDGMTELEFYRVLAPVIAEARCGHTVLSLSEEYQDYLERHGKYLPAEVRVVDGKLYILKDLSGKGIPKGAEITNINGKPASEIIAALLDNISSDGFNQTKKLYIINKWFNSAYYHFIGNPETFSVSYRRNVNDQPITVKVHSIRNRKMAVTMWNLHFGDINRSPVTKVEKDYAVLTLKSFASENKKQFREIIDGFFNRLAQRDTPNLIIDIRDNFGGEPYYSSYLLSYLIKKPSPYLDKSAPFYYFAYKRNMEPQKNRFKGYVYTLINGACFSTTGHFATLLRYHNIGTFIGEETGGSFICTDGARDMTLKNTKLRLHYATMPFKAAVRGLTKGRGIMPDVSVNPSIQDYFNGHDAIMTVALQLIKQKK